MNKQQGCPLRVMLYVMLCVMLGYAMLCYGSMFHHVDYPLMWTTHSISIVMEIANFIFLPEFHLALNLAAYFS